MKKKSAGKAAASGRGITRKKSGKARDEILLERLRLEIKNLKAEIKEKERAPNRKRAKQPDGLSNEAAGMFRSIVEGSPIPQFIIGPDHRVLSWNRALEATTGISAGDVIGTKNQWQAFYLKRRPTLADLLVDGDIISLRRWYGDKCRKSKLVSGAYEGLDYFPGKKGDGVWLSFTAVLIKDRKGGVIGALETLEDITERVRAEELLRKSELQFRQLAENAGEMIIVAQGDRFVYVNPMACAVTGFSEKELLTRPFMEFMCPDDRSMVAERYKMRLAGKKVPPVYELRMIHKRGGFRWLEINGVRIE